MMNKKLLLICLLFVATILMGASCDKREVPDPRPLAPIAEPTSTETVNSEASEVQPTNIPQPLPPISSGEGKSIIAEKVEYMVLMDNFKFEPSVITVKKGSEVTINAKAVDVTHGLSIPAYNINLTVPVGETVSTTFTADKEGTFPFRCSVYCGAGHSEMTGTLIVN